jgi:1,4-dihydroxy-2-naphthoyl-CoA hydrolase
MSDAGRVSPFDEHVGTEWLEIGPEEARGRITVADHHKQPDGAVHGGVYATLAESICSEATARAIAGEGRSHSGSRTARRSSARSRTAT